MIRKMAKESFIFQMEENMMGIGRTIKEAARVFFIGKMVKNTMVSGWTINRMVKGSFIYLKEENMMVIGKMIKEAAKGFIIGQTDKNMLVSGRIIKKMEMVS